MRRGRLYAHDPKGVIPRMSWSPHNLYNLISRSQPFFSAQATFKKTSMTMYQQRWKSKKLLRGYHGDWIREKSFMKWYLPVDLPNLKSRFKPDATAAQASSEEGMPISSLIFRDVERRLDTVVFRCCFARSAREARAMVVSGKVQVNGIQTTSTGTLLNPGDLISVLPEAIPMLGKDLAKQAEMRAAAVLSGQKEVQDQIVEEESTEAAVPDESTSSEEIDQPAQIKEATSEEAKEATSEISVEESVADASEGNAVESSPSEVVDNSANINASADADATVKAESTDEAKPASASTEAKGDTNAKKELAAGVHPFNLPPYAAPFIFVPPYLEVSFTTCSAIYMRHPTVTPVKATKDTRRYGEKAPAILYKTDIPSPYPAGGGIFSLAWEHYTKSAPRTRSDLRRLRLEAFTGTEGIKTARAKDAWKKVRAVRRGYDKVPSGPAQFPVGGLSNRKRPKAKTSAQSHLLAQQTSTNASSITQT